jgi:hypothetical protein
MPKDEVDPRDPLELRGVGLVTEQDTSERMAECFIEEFLRLGHDADQILALFRNPHYTGTNMVWQNRGEAFVRAKISEIFGWWKREVHWPDPPAPPGQLSDASPVTVHAPPTSPES